MRAERGLAVGLDSGAYKFVLVLHTLSAIVGFGAVFLNGMYGAQAKARRGSEGLAVAEANYLVSRVGEYFIYAVFVFGILLVVLSDDAWKFGDTWVWSSIALYILALAISHGVLEPNVRRMHALMRELAHMGPSPAGADAGGPPPQVAQLEQRGRTVGACGAALNLTLVAILLLMVWKPA